jgi:hypothetical protein
MKKKFITFSMLYILTGCQWIAMHPAEDLEAVELIEKAVEELYHHEVKVLSSKIPPGYPPMKLPSKVNEKGRG